VQQFVRAPSLIWFTAVAFRPLFEFLNPCEEIVTLDSDATDPLCKFPGAVRQPAVGDEHGLATFVVVLARASIADRAPVDRILGSLDLDRY